MKKYLLTLLSIAFVTTVYGATIFSRETGATPTNGKILQTNGTTNTWVATSSLGIVGFPSANNFVQNSSSTFNLGTTSVYGLLNANNNLAINNWNMSTSTDVCMAPDVCQFQTDGVNDDVVIQQAVNYWLSQADGAKITIKAGKQAYKITAPISMNLGGKYAKEFDGQGIFEVTAGIGNAFSLINGYNPKVNMKFKNGATSTDVGLYMRSIRGGEYNVYARSFGGIAIKVAPKTLTGDIKTSMLKFTHIECENSYQCFYTNGAGGADGFISAFGSIMSIWDFWSTKGPEFRNIGDFDIYHLEGGWGVINNGIQGAIFDSVQSLWIHSFSSGDETFTNTVLTITNSSQVKISEGLVLYGLNGLYMENVGLADINLVASSNTGNGVHLKNVYDSRISIQGKENGADMVLDKNQRNAFYLNSVTSTSSIIFTGSSTGASQFHVNINGSRLGAIIGTSTNAVQFSSFTGSIISSNTTNATGTYDIALPNVTSENDFNYLTITGANTTAAYNLNASNRMDVVGGLISDHALEYTNRPYQTSLPGGFNAGGSASSTAGDLVVDGQNKLVTIGRLSPLPGDGTTFRVRGRTNVTGFQADNSGNGYFYGSLGLGTTTPLALLSVNKNLTNFQGETLFAVASSSAPFFTISDKGITSIGANGFPAYLIMRDTNGTTCSQFTSLAGVLTGSATTTCP